MACYFAKPVPRNIAFVDILTNIKHFPCWYTVLVFLHKW
jgi:hypothetical protein